MFDTRIVGKKISELRKEKNMTQMELADILGVSYQAVSNWERGNSMPDISKLPELVEKLGCTIDDLLTTCKESEVIKHITIGGGEKYIKDNNITPREFASAAPIIPPKQTEDLLEIILNENIDKISIGDLQSIAAFVDEKFLERYIDKVENIENYSELIGLAPFLSEKTLDMLVDKCSNSGDIGTITGLAPFLSEESLDKLVMLCIEEGNIKKCTGLYPFLGEETLHKLADVLVKQYGFQALKELAPFL